MKMSAFLRCFGRTRDRAEISEDEKLEKKESAKNDKSANAKGKNCCRCRCHRSRSRSCDGDGDSTDGKSFSKNLPISVRGKKKNSCCEFESDADASASPGEYVSLPSPTASVDPSGTPFFIPSLQENLPGRSYMPVAKDDPVYNMKHPRRGKAIVFNFDRWDNTNIPNLSLSPRQGSEKDKRDLARCLKRLDFEVEEHDNKKHLEMWAVLETVRKEDHTDADCLVVVVMTHGEKNTVYVSDGTQIPINLIWENFEAHRCPSLAGKPKIFIVQACRGRQYDSGTKLHPSIPADYDTNRSDVTDSSTFSYVIPNAADIIVAFSCPLGHYSWRHPERGSWFIQAVCKVFNQHAYDMNLQELLTTVAREVALNYQSSTLNIESNNKKQVTSTSSTLIRNIFFSPKIRPPPGTNLPDPRPIPSAISNEIAMIATQVALQSYTSNIGAAATNMNMTTLATVEETSSQMDMDLAQTENGENVNGVHENGIPNGLPV